MLLQGTITSCVHIKVDPKQVVVRAWVRALLPRSIPRSCMMSGIAYELQRTKQVSGTGWRRGVGDKNLVERAG